MGEFVHDDFLLRGATARRLYHGHAAGLPIIDFHCHLDPHALAEDRSFNTLTELWIDPDPYKHRAMRMAGVPEAFITGTEPPRARYERWAATVPLTLGNPLFHWTALELKRTFGVAEPLRPESADRIWDTCTAIVRSPECTARRLVVRHNVECLCTSDALLDDLEPHAALARSGFTLRVLPSLRADDALDVGSPGYPAWLGTLGARGGGSIDSLDAWMASIVKRLDVFDQLHCRLADHALGPFAFEPASRPEADSLLRRRAAGEAIAQRDEVRLRSRLLHRLALEYGRRGWILQLHLGAQRATSSRLRALAGPAGGYAAIGPPCDTAALCRFLDAVERDGALPRTLLYPLNPADNAALASIAGSYAEDGVPGKIQLGPAWWYNDHRRGIREQLAAAAHYGLLTNSIGMTTDSRCLLSLSRHEYFRRVLCDLLGEMADAREIPSDEAALAHIVRSLAYENARRWILGGE